MKCRFQSLACIFFSGCESVIAPTIQAAVLENWSQKQSQGYNLKTFFGGGGGGGGGGHAPNLPTAA